MPGPILEVHDIRKRFGRLEALAGVSFTIDEGELFGLLGPNGAGKTTLIKILTTLLAPSSGTARVAGYDVATQADLVRPRRVPAPLPQVGQGFPGTFAVGFVLGDGGVEAGRVFVLP